MRALLGLFLLVVAGWGFSREIRAEEAAKPAPAAPSAPAEPQAAAPAPQTAAPPDAPAVPAAPAPGAPPSAPVTSDQKTPATDPDSDTVQKAKPIQTRKGPRIREKEAEGTEAPNRFEADPVIRSKYQHKGQSLEVDPD